MTVLLRGMLNVNDIHLIQKRLTCYKSEYHDCNELWQESISNGLLTVGYNEFRIETVC